MGSLAVRSGTDRPRLHANWDDFSEAKPFWH
jgi:hypothetical protein